MRSPITTHILDTAIGKRTNLRPAAEVSVVLSQKKATLKKIRWEELAQSMTNADGRVEDLLPAEHSLERQFTDWNFLLWNIFKKTIGSHSILR